MMVEEGYRKVYVDGRHFFSDWMSRHEYVIWTRSQTGSLSLRWKGKFFQCV